MKIGEKEKKKTGERSIDVYNRSKTKARPAGTIGQWYAIWFPLGTVMADRGYLGCSYSWCIINVGLTWPSRSTRIRRIAAKRPTADGPYKDPFYLCMCTGSLFQDKRWPGTRSPFCLWSSKPWTIPLSLSLSLPFRSGGELLRANGCTKLVSEDIRPSALFSGFYRRKNSSCFIPPAFHRAGIKERLIYFNRAISRGFQMLPSYLSLSNANILQH